MLQYIQESIKKSDRAPSYREIAAHFGFSSLGSVYKHILVLQKKGYLFLQKHCARSMTLNETLKKNSYETSHLIPYIGYVQAGFPLETFVKTDTISLPLSFAPKPEDTYVLRVRGNGFIEDQIAAGDYLIIEASSFAKAGETVLALVNNHDILLKRYFGEDDFIRLEASNPSYRPIIVRKENIQIQGVLIGVFRTL